MAISAAISSAKATGANASCIHWQQNVSAVEREHKRGQADPDGGDGGQNIEPRLGVCVFGV